MARNKGTFQFAANFEIKAAEALDPRMVVNTFSDLTNKETWPYDGDTLYVYNGMVVSVIDDGALYMLINKDNVLDKSSWIRVDVAKAERISEIQISALFLNPLQINYTDNTMINSENVL